MVKLFRLRGKREDEGEEPQGATAAEEATVAVAEEPLSAEERAAEEAELHAVMERTTGATRRGVFGRLGGLFRRGGVDDDFWDELEEILVLGDVGVNTATALIARVRQRARDEGARDPGAVRAVLREEMIALLERPAERGALWGARATALDAKPHVILVVGVNGAGKTTSIAKLAHAYREEGRRVILGAADTFRAAAIEQLQHWGERVGADVIASAAGADPGAVAYDTIGAAQSRGADIAIIDTAGRLQTKKNLMAELGKIRRVVEGRLPGAPHEVLLVLDATTGQNGLSQARVFAEATEVTGICLAKLDGTSKGGVVFAIADELDVPVRFAGTGEKPGDIAPFDAALFVDALLAGDD